jgi:transcriptional regulator of heat shock response
MLVSVGWWPPQITFDHRDLVTVISVINTRKQRQKINMEASVKIFGIQQTLKELNDFDKTYRKQVTKDIKKEGDVIVERCSKSLCKSLKTRLATVRHCLRMYKYSLN